MGKDITVKEGNTSLFVALVELKAKGLPDVWIYKHDVLAGRVGRQFATYMRKLKKDGTNRKDPGFVWHDLRSFRRYDHARKNDWAIITKRLK